MGAGQGARSLSFLCSVSSALHTSDNTDPGMLIRAQSITLPDPNSDLADLAWSPCGRYIAAWSSITDVRPFPSLLACCLASSLVARTCTLTAVPSAVHGSRLYADRHAPRNLHALLVALLSSRLFPFQRAHLILLFPRTETHPSHSLNNRRPEIPLAPRAQHERLCRAWREVRRLGPRRRVVDCRWMGRQGSFPPLLPLSPRGGLMMIWGSRSGS